MKKITYGLDRHTIVLRKLDNNGDVKKNPKEQYTVSVKKDLTPALTRLECALLQVNYTSSRRVAEKDEHRALLARKIKQGDADNCIYLSTLCVIGSLMSLSSKHKIYDLTKISIAVHERGELWEEAVEDFNSLFLNNDVRCFKKAVRHTQGRQILNRFLAGLKLVSDIFFESYKLKKSGLFEEANDLDLIMSDIGLMQSEAYVLLLSANHPEHSLLIDSMDEYNSCHELYRDEDDRWVMINKRKIKNINISVLEVQLQTLNDDLKIDKSSNDRNLDATESTYSASNEVIDSQSIDLPEQENHEPLEDGHLADTDDIQEEPNYADEQQEPNYDEQQEPGDDEQQEPGDDEQQEPGDDEQQEPGDDEQQEPGDDEQQEPNGDDEEQEHDIKTQHYSTTRRKPMLNTIPNVKKPSSRGMFSKPSNADGVKISLDEI